MNKSYLNILGLANAARKVITGETLLKSIKSNKISLVLIAANASENTKKKITDKCHYYHIQYYIVDEESDILGKAIGKENRVAVGIADRGFAKKIKEIIGG